MRKEVGVLKVFAVLSVLLFSFVSCKKDSHKMPFEAKVKTFYRVSPTKPMTIDVGGTTYISSAFFPGAGTGTATYLGDCDNYFNQLVYGTAADAPPSGSVSAPVAAVPGYPVTGAPLPLIQPGDFDILSAAMTALHVPDAIDGKIINSVFRNSKGEAIYTSAITGSGGTYPLSATVVGFNGKALIVGGVGRFSHASGEIDYEGYFNVVNPNDATLNAKGWISF